VQLRNDADGKLQVSGRQYTKLSTAQGRIQDFKLGGAHLKKLRRAEGGAKIVGVFRVKNHDFTLKNHIFPILDKCNTIWVTTFFY
jgi:hypothetical protein